MAMHMLQWLPAEEDLDNTLAHLPEHTIKQLVRLGYTLCKTTNNVTTGLPTRDCADAEMKRQMATLQENRTLDGREIQQLTQAMQKQEQHHAQVIESKEALHTTTIGCLKEENERLRLLLQETEVNRNNQTILNLRSTLQKQTEEIARLRNSNSGKGCLGEGLIEEMLRANFPANEIRNTSAVGHSCDIIMTDAQNRAVVFESKNRQSISKADVDRFRSDVQNMADNVIGGVFVSLRCANIPGLGPLAVELIGETTGRVLLFLGYRETADFEQYFGAHMQMFCCLCAVTRQTTCADQKERQMHDMLEDLKFYQVTIQRNQKNIRHLLSTIDTDFALVLCRMQARLLQTEQQQTLKREQDIVSKKPRLQ
jgi:hypothetical protein